MWGPGVWCIGFQSKHYFNGPEGDCRLVKIVDDLGFSESSTDQHITKNTIAALKKAYHDQVTSDLSPSSFAGYKVTISDDDAGRRIVSLSQKQKIVEAARKYLPELLENKRPDGLLVGTALETLLDSLKLAPEKPAKLDSDQKMVQQILGDLKYFERGSMPRLSLMVHRLSCIMSAPPPGSLVAAKSVLAIAYHHRDEKITYGRPRATRGAILDGFLAMDIADGAPAEFEASADASTTPRDVYAMLLTCNGASVSHSTKKIGIAVGSTYDAENFGTVRVSELACFGRIVQGALGIPLPAATRILTDGQSNQRVCQNAQSSARSRYFLIRAACLHQRIASGEVTVVHVNDPSMPADFLTKHVPKAKTETSIAYALGASG